MTSPQITIKSGALVWWSNLGQSSTALLATYLAAGADQGALERGITPEQKRILVDLINDDGVACVDERGRHMTRSDAVASVLGCSRIGG